MKKLLSMLLIVSLLCGLTPSALTVEAASTSSVSVEDNIEVELDEDGTLTVSGTGSTADYWFYSYRDMEQSPWSENSDIKKIIIEEGVTRIGNRMFFDCVNVEEIVFPSTLTSIGEQAFSGLAALTSVEIPNTLTDLGWCAFVECHGLEEFIVADDHPTLSVEDGVLFNKDKTTLIQYPTMREAEIYTVPEGVTEISSYSFDECLLTTVHFPSTLKTIGDEAFHSSNNLYSIEIPEGVLRIGGGAFQECWNLASISLPSTLRFLACLVFDETAYYRNEDNWENDILYIDSILVVAERWDGHNYIEPSGDIEIKAGTTLIAGDAFFGNDDITSVTFPESLKHICEGAFYSCGNLKSVTFPESLETLDDLSFNSCSKLSDVRLGSQLTYIGYSVFESTPYISNSSNYTDGVLYNNHYLLLANNSIAKDYHIEEGTKLIASRAFKGNSALSSISFPESLTTIGEWAFIGCDSLKEVEIPSTVTSIYDKAFGYDYVYDRGLDEEVITKYDKFLISGYLNTQAHNYALANGFLFNDLESCQHTGEYEIVDSVEVGCLTNGYTGDKKCIECGEIFEKGETIPCNGKHIELPYDYVPATCTEPGYEFGCYCVVCGEVLIPRTEIAPTGHFERTLLGYNATCTEPGLEDGVECGVCHVVLEEQEVIPAYGCYTYSYVETQGTLESDGEKVVRCEVCDTVYETTIIGKASIEIKEDSFVFSGRRHTPEIIVTDRFGNTVPYRNYDICIASDAKSVGVHTFTVEFYNDYAGSFTGEMTIYPKGTRIISAQTEETSTKVKIAVLADYPEHFQGYELRYSTSADFSKDVKTVKTKNAFDNEPTLSGLNPLTEYYLQVRTFKDEYYSDWSDTFKISTEGEVAPPECTKHSYSKTYTIDEPASTTKNGSKSQHCKNCDAKKNVKTIYKLGTVKLGTTTYTYNGKTKSPKLIIKDSKGNTISSDNYTVTKSKGRTSVGKYTYKISFKNEYKGIKAKTLTFKINPKETSLKTVTASKKAFTVKWNKVSTQATGYEVMYSTSKNFTEKTSKTVTVKSYKTTSKKVSGLKAKKKYYVKVRTYKTVSGVKFYSDWSKTKTVTTK